MVNRETLPAQRLRSLNLLAFDLHLLNILKVFFLQTVEDFFGMAENKTESSRIQLSNHWSFYKPRYWSFDQDERKKRHVHFTHHVWGHS